MKTIKIVSLLLVALSFAACSLKKDPIAFSELTAPRDSTDTNTKEFTTREQMNAQRSAMYATIRGAQEAWYLDYLVYSEVHADNAYRGTSGSELASLEAESQDGINKNIARDWNAMLNYVNNANRIILNIDSIPDPLLTATEHKQWKSEAMIFRAWVWFDMVRLWGAIPLVMQKTPNVTSENIEQVYPLLFPSRDSVDKVYKQIITDLEYAADNAPEVDAQNKFLLSKAVANGLLAKVYAERPVRDYSKVINYCNKVQNAGFALVNNYADLFDYNTITKDAKLRNSSESIFEITFYPGSGSWVTWMFGIDMANANSVYDWAKWITPSRDLIKAYETEGDNIRMNASIVWGQPSWSNHYPSSHYPFMYKTRSAYNSIIKLRLADILLLKAEAEVAVGNLGEAANLVNQIRNRVNLANLPSSVTSSSSAMENAVLNERRLELAFEGQRWFDLVRTGKAINVLNTLNQRDAGRIQMVPLTEQTILLPIPQVAIDANVSLTQNPGY